MKLQHIILSTLLSISLASNFKTGNFDRHKKAKNKFKNSNSLLGQIRSMALNKLPKMLKNQRRLIDDLTEKQINDNEKIEKSLEKAKTEAENALKVEIEKRETLENQYLVDKQNFNDILNRLNSEFVDLKERFEKLQEKSREIVDIWFDPSDKYYFALNFEEDYNAEFASGTESSVLMNDDSDMIVL